MLSKSYNFVEQFAYDFKSNSFSVTSSGGLIYQNIYTNNSNYTKTVKITNWTASGSWISNGNFIIYMSKDGGGTHWGQCIYYYPASTWQVWQNTMVLEPWESLDVYLNNVYWGSHTWTVSELTFEASPSKEAKNYNVCGYPTNIENIWNLGKINIFWLKDKDFFTWFPTTSTATTGSITPWNFVGYLQIWDYKIPYYK